MAQEIQLGVKGVPVRVQVLDEAGAAVPVDGPILFRFAPPDGAAAIEVAGVIQTAAEGRVAYVLQDGDGIAEAAGTWKYQVDLELTSGFDGKTTAGTFEVLYNV